MSWICSVKHRRRNWTFERPSWSQIEPKQVWKLLSAGFRQTPIGLELVGAPPPARCHYPCPELIWHSLCRRACWNFLGRVAFVQPVAVWACRFEWGDPSWGLLRLMPLAWWVFRLNHASFIPPRVTLCKCWTTWRLAFSWLQSWKDFSESWGSCGVEAVQRFWSFAMRAGSSWLAWAASNLRFALLPPCATSLFIIYLVHPWSIHSDYSSFRCRKFSWARPALCCSTQWRPKWLSETINLPSRVPSVREFAQHMPHQQPVYPEWQAVFPCPRPACGSSQVECQLCNQVILAHSRWGPS